MPSKDELAVRPDVELVDVMTGDWITVKLVGLTKQFRRFSVRVILFRFTVPLLMAVIVKFTAYSVFTIEGVEEAFVKPNP
jgi:hypothetical protein